MHFWLIDFSKMPFNRSYNGVFYNPTIRMRDGKIRYVPDKDGAFNGHIWTLAFRNNLYSGLKWYIFR